MFDYSNIYCQVDGSGLQICIILTIHSITLNIDERKRENYRKSRFYHDIPSPPLRISESETLGSVSKKKEKRLGLI